MNPDLLTMALIVGVFTWAFRFLPTRLDLSKLHPDGRLVRFLAATGPAAIATLVVASSWPMLTGRLADMGPLVAGVLAVVAVFGWRRSVVAATLAGSVVYALAFALA
ncbi:MAG: AzlD domain-containing protein [Pseudorhodobacter sp.]|nr:AzlD domain-containing protein [Pseudorhodobacter sp.]